MKEKTIYALGFFDGVHVGHTALLARCRQLADQYRCIAGVITFDVHPDALVLGKAPGLINTSTDRERLLSAQGVDTVVSLPFDENMKNMPWQSFLHLLITQHNAWGIVVGSDFRFGKGGEGTAQALEAACRAQGMPSAVIPQKSIDGTVVSSTHIRKLLQGGEMAQAVRFLGHPHILSGKVVSGRRLGRTLGIPTANLHIPQEIVVPKLGVYACLACFDGQKLPAVTNVGNRPTVGGHCVTVEPWILDFDGDLYGKEITLEFHAFLREEEKFPNLEALKAEIQENAQQVRNFFGKN